MKEQPKKQEKEKKEPPRQTPKPADKATFDALISRAAKPLPSKKGKE